MVKGQGSAVVDANGLDVGGLQPNKAYAVYVMRSSPPAASTVDYRNTVAGGVTSIFVSGYEEEL